MKLPGIWKRGICAVTALAGVLASTSAHPRAQNIIAPDVTYILPVFEQYVSVSDAEFAAEVAKLRSRLGPEGSKVRLGFTAYVFVDMGDSTVDITSPSAVRAALQSTIDQIDSKVARARAHGIPICLSFLTASRSRTDGLELGFENADVRNTQWYGGAEQATDNTIEGGWMTYSRYARRYRAVQEAYVREIGKVIAKNMALYPDTLVASAGDGEVELSYNRSPIINPNYTTDTMMLADFSPMAILEFRDWLTAGGLYAAGQPFDGQAYENASRYSNNLAQINQDFGTSFTNFNLRYFDWSVSNEAGSVIPKSQYSGGGFNRHPSTNPGGFDAPRSRDWSSVWYQVWLQFRRQMVLRHNLDFAKWITTSVDSGPGSGGTGTTVPSSRWYSYQIPGDRLYGFTPDDPSNVRYETSASAWWTGDITPYGGVGLTSFNTYAAGYCGSPDPKVNYFCRTLAGLAPQIAQRNVRWGLLEWHPGVGIQSHFPPASDVYGEEMKLVEQYHPSLLAPYALYTTTEGDPNTPDPLKPFYDSGFETALKALIARLNGGAPVDSVPVITANPASQTVTAGQSAAFTVTATGGALTYQWQRSTDGVSWVNVSDGSPYSGATTAALTVTGATVGLSGTQYRVIVTNGQGSATSSAATLTVNTVILNTAPAITTQPSDQAALPGTAVTFSATSAGTAPLTYQWQILTTSGGSFTNLSNGTPYAGADTAALTVVAAASLSGAQYRVRVFNSLGSATSNAATLTVTAAPSFTGQPVNRTINEGEGVSFSVAAAGSPAPSYQWQRSTNGGGTWTDLTNTSPYGGVLSSSLTITNATLSMNGTRYRAVAVNAFGTTASDSARLTVNGPSNTDMVLETPGTGSVPTPFTIGGWAVDRGSGLDNGIDVVHVYAYPIVNGSLGDAIFVGQTFCGTSRPDIAGVFGSQFSGAGFSMTGSLTPGAYRLVAYGRSLVTNQFSIQRSVDINVQLPVANPAMWIDAPAQGATRSPTFRIEGWAVDLGSGIGTGVDAIHVYAFPIVGGALGAPTFVGIGTYGATRNDIGAAFGSRFTNSGFTLVASLDPGTYRVIAYAHSMVSGTFNNAQAADVIVRAPVSVPVMSLDGPAAGTVEQPFLAGGWAVDLGADTGTGIDAIHVWAFRVSDGAPFFVAQGIGGGARSDVGAVFGSQFSTAGFTFVVQGLSPGQYDLGVYAHSSVSGTFNQVKFVRITIR